MRIRPVNGPRSYGEAITAGPDALVGVGSTLAVPQHPGGRR